MSKEYLSERLKRPTTRQLDPFLEKVCTFDDWLEIKSKIKLAKLETDEDYLQLLDDIILCKIRYFEDTSGKEIKSTKIRPLMICNFKFDCQVDIPTDFHQYAIDDFN